jgi:uncharacterized protein
MKHLIYLHGFLSAPASTKAQQTAIHLSQHQNWQYLCPALSSYPDVAVDQLHALLENLPLTHVGLVGSSLGGFWAKYLAERHDLPAVLINPAVAPDQLLAKYIGQSLQNYYNQDTYLLTSQHAAVLSRCDAGALKHPENLWVWLQTGDETLDYRDAATYYAACRVEIAAGGNHSYAGFEQRLPEILQFFTDFWAKKG